MFTERSRRAISLAIATGLCFLILTPAWAQIPEGTTVIRPQEIDDVLYNPGIGFSTFQRFNGDTANVLQHCCGDFKEGFPFPVAKDKKGNLINPGYVPTTIAYLRFYWRFIEPEKDQYRWDIIDRALRTARERGQTLMLSLMPYGSHIHLHDVPDWYRELVGPETEFKYNNPVNKWLVDPEDPRYIQHYGQLIREFGNRYDGHPDLESVDIRIVGAWGEGAGTGDLSRETARALVNAYTDVFKKTPIKVLLTDEYSNSYALTQAPVGYRADCLGDLSFWAAEQNGWTHMYDYYPQGIEEFGLSEAWRNGPVSFEMCGTFPGWNNRQKYTEEDVAYIFDQALKWHISSFNGKSTHIPERYMPLVQDFLKKMGYRFVLRRFTYPAVINRNQKVEITSWWENKGVAPIYKDFPLVIRFKQKKREQTFTTDADIKSWLPGDNVYNTSLFLPADMKPGKYEVQIAMVDPVSGMPKVQLAIEGRGKDGWYSLGTIEVR